jgi:hypothetical protein
MNDELENYRRQFETINRDAHRLLDGLVDAQLVWRPRVESWSIADCLNHLVVTGRVSLTHIHSAVVEARSRNQFSSGFPWRSVLGSLLIRLMDAPPKLKFKAPQFYAPVLNLTAPEIVNNFFLLQDEMVLELYEAEGLNLARVKVGNPFSKWLKLSLGQEFAFTAAHERRHLWQAWRVRENATFPCRSSPPNKSLDASGGSVFRIMTGPAMLD